MKLNNGLYISLDFEQFWGWDDEELDRSTSERLLKTVDVIRQTLELFKKYEISATWATVGYLFGESSNDVLQYYRHKDIERLPNALKKNYSRLKALDGSNYNCYFALEIIKLINSYPNQEIASHTFSHFYSLEHDVTKKDFIDDIILSQKITEDKGFEANKSIVFPRNQVAYIDELNSLGIKYYRGNQRSFAYQESDTSGGRNIIKRYIRLIDRYIPLYNHSFCINEVNNTGKSIINIPGSRFCAPYISRLKSLENIRLKRIKIEMSNAANNNKSYHLWWHPHNFAADISINLNFLEEILKHYKTLNQNGNFLSLKMEDAANE